MHVNLHFVCKELTETKAKRKHVSRYDVVMSELDHYDQEPLLDLDEDPLEWWQVQYPLMSQVVKKYWSLPATSVGSEAAFSTAGNVLTNKRNRLLQNWYLYMIICFMFITPYQVERSQHQLIHLPM